VKFSETFRALPPPARGLGLKLGKEGRVDIYGARELILDRFRRTHTLPAGLVEVVDIVKVDFPKTSVFTRHHIARTLRRPGMKMLAEKVETRPFLMD